MSASLDTRQLTILGDYDGERKDIKENVHFSINTYQYRCADTEKCSICFNGLSTSSDPVYDGLFIERCVDYTVKSNITGEWFIRQTEGVSEATKFPGASDRNTRLNVTNFSTPGMTDTSRLTKDYKLLSEFA